MAKQRQLEEYKATYAQQVLDDDESLFFVYKMFGDSISNTPPQLMIWDLMMILTIVMSSWFVETRLNKIIINVHCLLSWRLYRFSK